MVGVPRSQRLLGYRSTASGPSPAFVCPSGHVALVKNAYFWNASAAGVEVWLSVTGATWGVALVHETIDATSGFAWEGWLVMHPGDQLSAWAGAASVDINVAGAVLAGAPLFPPAELADPLVWPEQPLPLPAAAETPPSTAGLPRRRRSI